VIGELTGEQLDTVLAAKADAAWHLHHLTRDADLDAFVMFSAAAAVLGAAGQANYAAANAFCDALAYHRRGRQHATSLAWGYWPGTGMTGQLSSAEQTRLTRGGVVPISTDHGLALFDAALSQQQPYLIPCPFNASALAGRARQQILPAILSGLTRARPQAATGAGPATLARQLAAQTPDKQLHTLTVLVATATATVLAHPDPAALDTERPFKDLGIDSLTALELRNIVTAQTGLSLPATVIFDHPTPAALASHIHHQIGADGETGQAGDPRDSEIYQLIASIPIKQLREAGILDMLLGMVGRGESSQPDGTDDVANMNLDELLTTLGD
jgi:polyene macrolide polyketide synthase